jgi:hypothetical protein
MIELKPFVDLMKAAGFDGAGGALEFAEIGKGLGRGAWAYMIPERDSPEPSKGTQRIEQRVTQSFIVALYIPTGSNAKASDALKLYHEKTRDALLGWCPLGSDRMTPLQYRGAALNSIQPGSLIWAQQWSYSFYIRKDV